MRPSSPWWLVKCTIGLRPASTAPTSGATKSIDRSLLTRTADAWCAALGPHLQRHRLAVAVESGLVYAYARPPETTTDDHPADPAQAAAAWCAAADAHGLIASNVEASRLQLQMNAPGHSAASAPRFHYVVETDPETGWADTIYRWYNEEHLPGLAAVPGCCHAWRFLNVDHGPQSLACYDLTEAQVLGSPPWLAVRHTDWSSRCRPHFTNTRRTMMETIA